MTKDLYPELYDYYKNLNTKIGQKVFDVLDSEGIAGIISDDKVFWFESSQRGDQCSQTIYNHIKKTLNKKGYEYLYDKISRLKSIF